MSGAHGYYNLDLMQQPAETRLRRSFGLPLVFPLNDVLARRSSSWLTLYFKSRQCLINSNEYRILMSHTATLDETTAFFYLLAHVAEQLTEASKPTLQQIVATLKANSSQEHPSPGRGCDGGASADPSDKQSLNVLPHLVFRAIGWLTLLYQAQISVDPTNGYWTYQPMAIKGETTHHSEVLSVVLNGNSTGLPGSPETKSVYLLLKQIGQHLIPGSSVSSMKAAPPSSITARPDFFSEQLVGSYLNYTTLKKVAKIEVDFVPLASMHLDFDEHSRRLKIFALPSWCVLMAYGDLTKPRSGSTQYAGNATMKFRQLPYLSQLLGSYLYGRSYDTQDDNSNHNEYAAFCREILLSYSLICGHRKSATSLFRKDYRRYLQSNNDDHYPTDPLLLDICDRSQNLLFSRLGVAATKQQYSRQTEFPILGCKLVRLQGFVVEQNPIDWQTLLHDKRDILRYWTFWAVILVGGMSIIMSFIQVLLTIVQVVIQIKMPTNG